MFRPYQPVTLQTHTLGSTKNSSNIKYKLSRTVDVISHPTPLPLQSVAPKRTDIGCLSGRPVERAYH
jgi:hypothetical protein